MFYVETDELCPKCKKGNLRGGCGKFYCPKCGWRTGEETGGIGGTFKVSAAEPAVATSEEVPPVEVDPRGTVGDMNAAVEASSLPEPAATPPTDKTDAWPTAVRRRLPDERESITHKFDIGGHQGYITVGKYDDGRPGEIFITMAKEGSMISGLMDSFATMTSVALQYGVPLQLLVDKFTHTRFEPSGFTKNPEIPMVKSVMDYIFKWLAIKFIPRENQQAVGTIGPAPQAPAASLAAAIDTNKIIGFVMPEKISDAVKPPKHGVFLYQQDAPSCSDCGEIMVRNGACYKCMNCGATSGCS